MKLIKSTVTLMCTLVTGVITFTSCSLGVKENNETEEANVTYNQDIRDITASNISVNDAMYNWAVGQPYTINIGNIESTDDINNEIISAKIIDVYCRDCDGNTVENGEGDELAVEIHLVNNYDKQVMVILDSMSLNGYTYALGKNDLIGEISVNYPISLEPGEEQIVTKAIETSWARRATISSVTELAVNIQTQYIPDTEVLPDDLKERYTKYSEGYIYKLFKIGCNFDTKLREGEVPVRTIGSYNDILFDNKDTDVTAKYIGTFLYGLVDNGNIIEGADFPHWMTHWGSTIAFENHGNSDITIHIVPGTICVNGINLEDACYNILDDKDYDTKYDNISKKHFEGMIQNGDYIVSTPGSNVLTSINIPAYTMYLNGIASYRDIETLEFDVEIITYRSDYMLMKHMFKEHIKIDRMAYYDYKD